MMTRLADNIVRYLVHHGYEALAVHSAQAALRAIVERAPDIALIDLSQPDGHGAELFRHINQQLPDMPALIISATLDATLIASLRHFGMRGFLAKPFSLATMLGLIEADLKTDRTLSSQLRPNYAAD